MLTEAKFLAIFIQNFKKCTSFSWQDIIFPAVAKSAAASITLLLVNGGCQLELCEVKVEQFKHDLCMLKYDLILKV